jgi:DNA repair protein RecO (recombination protein O)
MEWTDRGIVLSARKHGETSLIVQLMTENHGRHAGLVRGGTSTRARGLYQPGNVVAAHWRARLAEHLGNYGCEMLRGTAARFLHDAPRLSALAAAAAIVEAALPEREPHADIFAALLDLLECLESATWPKDYVRWELGLLAALGFGLDLAACAATGRADALAYVSPKTGRAVSAAAGEPYRGRLLELPGFLVGVGEPDAAGLRAGLLLTGHFLESCVFLPHGRHLPAARERLASRLAATPTQPIDA